MTEKTRAGERIGNNLRRLREERHLTQTELGVELEISAESISRFERGIIIPSGKHLDRIAEFFGVDFQILFSSDEGFNQYIEAIRKGVFDELRRNVENYGNQYGFVIRVKKDEG